MNTPRSERMKLNMHNFEIIYGEHPYIENVVSFGWSEYSERMVFIGYNTYEDKLNSKDIMNGKYVIVMEVPLFDTDDTCFDHLRDKLDEGGFITMIDVNKVRRILSEDNYRLFMDIMSDNNAVFLKRFEYDGWSDLYFDTIEDVERACRELKEFVFCGGNL